MNLALLGADPSSQDLARAAAAGGGHRLVWGCELGGFEAEFRRLAPAATISPHWEDLLSGELAEGLIVGRSSRSGFQPDESGWKPDLHEDQASEDDLRADQLRKLVQAGVPLLVSHPIHSSMLLYYELDMIQQESRAPLLAYLPARWHPGVERIVQLLAAVDGLGRLEQVVFERHMTHRSKPAVQSQFAVDVDLARLLCGELNRIGAMAPSGAAERYANLGVQLSGPSGTLVRWSVEPVEDQPGAKLTLLAASGRATLWMPQAPTPWRLDLVQRDRSSSQEFPAASDAPRRALDMLASCIVGGGPKHNWLDACRAVELADSIDRSLEKGRTLELHFDDYTEQGTFKGFMTSLGCGLLMLALVMLPVAGVAARLHVPLARYWAVILLAIFLVFLLMQGLRFVFAKPDSKPESGGMESSLSE